MTISAKNEFQINATPGEELSRHLAYLASQGNDSVLTGGFSRDGVSLERDETDRAQRQTATAMEFLAQQEQHRQERLAALANRFDALEQAARDALTDAENDLAAILSNANRDNSGRAVFKDKDGNIRDEEGQIIDPSEIDMSEWDDDRPSWEDLEQAFSRRAQAAETYDRVQDKSTQLNDPDLDDQDLRDLEEDFDALEAEIAALQEADIPAPKDAGYAPADDRTADQPSLTSKDALTVPGL